MMPRGSLAALLSESAPFLPEDSSEFLTVRLRPVQDRRTSDIIIDAILCQITFHQDFKKKKYYGEVFNWNYYLKRFFSFKSPHRHQRVSYTKKKFS